MYYCNCVEAHEAKGVKVPNTTDTRAGIWFFQEVQVDKEKCCVHCGHYAVASDIPVTGLTYEVNHE